MGPIQKPHRFLRSSKPLSRIRTLVRLILDQGKLLHYFRCDYVVVCSFASISDIFWILVRNRSLVSVDSQPFLLKLLGECANDTQRFFVRLEFVCYLFNLIGVSL